MFLLHRGDYLSAFIDLAGPELRRDAHVHAPHAATAATATTAPTTVAALASAHRLQSLLELAIRSSNASHDPNTRRLRATLAPTSLLAYLEHLRTVEAAGADGSSAVPPPPLTPASGLRGYNAFTLSYEASWPLSLVLSPRAMSRYAAVFRHLFFARYVEAAVCACWAQHQSCKDLALRTTLATSYTLRQRMLHFLQNLTYFSMVEVIEPRWHEMAAQLRLATSIDDVIRSHDAFLDAVMRECLLTSPDLLKVLIKLITLCLLFASQISDAIESHRLSTAELDRRTGLSKASARAKAQLERGEYYGSDEEDGGGDDDGGGSVASRGSRTALRRAGSGSLMSATAAAGATLSKAGAAAARERERRRARVTLQTEAMQRTMAQQGWQSMIVKSSRMFDALLRDLLAALYERTRGDVASHLRHLCLRLDHNGFYARHLGLREPDAVDEGDDSEADEGGGDGGEASGAEMRGVGTA